MSTPSLLQGDFSRGMVRDVARHLMPKGSSWNLVNLFPNLDGTPLTRRGGWTYASSALTGTGQVRCDHVAWAPFAGGAKLVVVDDDLAVWSVSGGTPTSTGGSLAALPLQRAVFFKDLLIWPGATPKKYSGSGAPANLGGSPPGGQYAETYRSRLILAGTSAQPRNVYFSDPLDPETWDTTNSFIQMTHAINGVASLRNAILVFSTQGVERIRGDIPPPGGDMIREPLFPEGCIDARSIVVTGDRVVWVNTNGVWQSDGAALENLAEAGGVLNYWNDLMASKTSSYTFAGGTIRGHYVLAVMNGNTFVDCLMCDLRKRTWLRMSNIPTKSFAEAPGEAPELYMGLLSQPRPAQFAPIFNPASGSGEDADGTDVDFTLETPFYRGNTGLKRWRNIRVGYTLGTGSSPEITLEYITGPDDPSYSSVSSPGLNVTGTQHTYGKTPLGVLADGVGLRVDMTGVSSEVHLFDLEADVADREPSRR